MSRGICTAERDLRNFKKLETRRGCDQTDDPLAKAGGTSEPDCTVSPPQALRLCLSVLLR